MWLTIPSKQPAGAKSRLASLLSPRQRRDLHFHMLEDVLSAALDVPALNGTCVVTTSAEVAATARRFGALVLHEPALTGHRRAVVLGARHLESTGMEQMMILPGDVPLITAPDIEIVLAAHRGERTITFVPDHRGQGSNCIVMTPGAAPALMIGCGRFQAHIDTAAKFGFKPGVVRNANIAHDIDTPADLAELFRRGTHTRAGRFLLEAGIAGTSDCEKTCLADTMAS